MLIDATQRRPCGASAFPVAAPRKRNIPGFAAWPSRCQPACRADRAGARSLRVATVGPAIPRNSEFGRENAWRGGLERLEL